MLTHIQLVQLVLVGCCRRKGFELICQFPNTKTTSCYLCDTHGRALRPCGGRREMPTDVKPDSCKHAAGSTSITMCETAAQIQNTDMRHRKHTGVPAGPNYKQCTHCIVSITFREASEHARTSGTGNANFPSARRYSFLCCRNLSIVFISTRFVYISVCVFFVSIDTLVKCTSLHLAYRKSLDYHVALCI